jgi:superfamily II DNA or RNA helicase
MRRSSKKSTAMNEYDAFVAQKLKTVDTQGLDVNREELHESLFDYQRDIVAWSLRRGRSCIFADCGTGKTLMQLVWADVVTRETDGRVLILAPLAVADQTVREGERFGIEVEHVESIDDAERSVARILITNYARLERFAPMAWSGIVLDESSILKAYDGATRNAIISGFSHVPYRLACTATPAPNDHMELGNHSEFLGVKTRAEMLAEYFVHDGGDTSQWRLKGHAEDIFWRWVCAWAAFIRKPSDLGYSDEGYEMPALIMRDRILPVDHQDAWSEGFLFAPDVVTLSDQRATRRATLTKRVNEAAALVADEPTEPWMIWCELNDESTALTKAIPGAVEVSGGMPEDVKADRLLGFAEGRYQILVSKPSIAGWGMNYQHCARTIFVGASHSYEQTYQALRRFWRYGQKRDVHAYVIRAETEGAISANMARKEADAQRMADGMLEHMRDAQRMAIRGSAKEWNPYQPSVEMTIPAWCQKEE